MKFKTLIVTLLLLLLISPSFDGFVNAQSNRTGTLKNPTAANAGFDPISALSTIYNVMCTIRGVTGSSGDCEVNRDTWSGGLVFIDLGFNTAVARTICNRSGDDITINGEKCYDPDDYAYNNAMLASGRYPGGLAAATSQTYAYVAKESPVPTNLALYVNDVLDNTYINTPVYAAGPLQILGFQRVIFETWKISRNIALAFIGVFLAYSALLVIFRRKLNPQTFISVYNILPLVPIVILLIVLSYPIIAVVLKATGPLIWTAVWAVSSAYTGYAGDMNHALTSLISLAINSLFSISTTLPAFSLSVLMMIGILAAGVMVSLVAGLVSIMKAYASMFIATVASPLVLLAALLPGKASLITNLGKRILVDMLTLPLVLATIMLGALIISRPTGDLGPGSFALLPYIWYGSTFFLYTIKVIIGMIVMLQSRKIRSTLENTLRVGGLFGVEQQKQRR